MLFSALADLPRGKALPITFQDEGDVYYARTALRKLAKKEGFTLSSSKRDGETIVYFWLEAGE